MLSALWRNSGYLLLTLFVFVLALMYLTPLHFVWQHVSPRLGSLPVNVERIQGTIKQGTVVVNDPRLGALSVRWELAPSALLTGRVRSHIIVEGNGLRFQGNLQASSNSHVAIDQGKAFVDSAFLRPFVRQPGVTLAGDIQLNDFHVELGQVDNRWRIDDISGLAVYSGGRVSFPIQGKPTQSDFPLLLGKLGMQQQNAVLNVTTDDGKSIGTGFVQQDGWGGVKVRRRLLDVIGQRWSANTAPDQIIFEVSQKIL